jgi:hypothetical protein
VRGKQPEVSSKSNADLFDSTAEWYLTVRCTNPACSSRIAFQKARYSGDNVNIGLAVSGPLSVDCPHCWTRVRFQGEQIERRLVRVDRQKAGVIV